MRKLILGTIVLLAIASIGGMNLHTTHAAAGPEGTSQQQLDVMKATLINLEMQQGVVPGGDEAFGGGTAAASPTAMTEPPSALSPADAASVSAALSGFAVALQSLQSKLAANPVMDQTEQAGVVATLQGIGNTLLSIEGMFQGGSMAPIAEAQGNGSATASAAAPLAESTPKASAPVAEATVAAASATSKTVQTASIVTFAKTHWPTMAIVTLVIAILGVLFWPNREKAAIVLSNQSPKKQSA